MRRRLRRKTTVKVDPRDWIDPPFADCPFCAASNAMGLLMVGGRRAVRRCRKCMRECVIALPEPPTPRVLYLDQLVLSNFVKLLLPEHRHKFGAENAATLAGWWPRAYARVEKLVKLGLLVCPPSSLHRRESALNTELFGPLTRLHEHLANEWSFEEHAKVKIDQIYGAFCAWLDGSAVPRVQRGDAVRGVSSWPSLVHITAQVELSLDETEFVRRVRVAQRDNLREIVQEWRGQAGRSYLERQREQLAAFGPAEWPPVVLGELWVLTRHAMDERGIEVRERDATVKRFLDSPEVASIPYARIATGLLAALGWQAARHQAKPVDTGLRDDIQAIATYAPYCDAMFVDRQMRVLLTESPLAHELANRLKVFATDRRAEFDAWLDEVERSAPQGHLRLVREIYGHDWLEPYSSILGAD